MARSPPGNQADAGAARAAGTFRNDISSSVRRRDSFLRAAARQHLLLTLDIGFDGAPFTASSPATGTVSMPNSGACDRSPSQHPGAIPALIVDEDGCFEIPASNDGRADCGNAGTTAAETAKMHADDDAAQGA